MKLIIATLLCLVAAEVDASLNTLVEEAVSVRPFDAADSESLKNGPAITDCREFKCALKSKGNNLKVYAELNFVERLDLLGEDNFVSQYTSHGPNIQFPFDGIHIVTSASTVFPNLESYIDSHDNDVINGKSLITIPYESNDAGKFKNPVEKAVPKFKAVFITVPDKTSLKAAVKDVGDIAGANTKIVFILEGSNDNNSQLEEANNYVVVRAEKKLPSSSTVEFKHPICISQ
ncbi:hypothetical protein DSO57_1016858 [Entomophthora muscae]|uniref:Uncharacterized protein n=1 Tax=Entomophthora muscae TaxID=34485 RepID=A0ACC2S6K5_9FUNG|nr:hypothetical protein DSO57_1016858 [Entomophthora muscae]